MMKLESVNYPAVGLHIKSFTGNRKCPDSIVIYNGDDGVPVRYVRAAEDCGAKPVQRITGKVTQ